MSKYSEPPPALDGADVRRDPVVRRGAKAIVSSRSRVLLVKERHADRGTFWTLPGGGVRPQESLIGAVRRELDEELCCRSVVHAPVSTFWYAHLNPPPTVTLYTAFDCSVLSAVQPARSEGILDSAWVTPDEPPVDTLLPVRRLLRTHTH